jgi:hypothetical protein
LELFSTLGPEGGVNGKKLLSMTLDAGIWFTVVTTASQVGWNVYAHVSPGWESWRTPRVRIATAVAVAYCIGKVGVFYLAKRRVNRAARATSA